jgi:hypothetical protein
MHKQITFPLLIITTVATQAMQYPIKETHLTREQIADVYFATIIKNKKETVSTKKSSKTNKIELSTGTTYLPSLFIVTKQAKL